VSDILTQARKAAADQYDQAWPLRATMGNLASEGFLAGWDAAMNQVALLMQTPGGDGCYCAHHPDDPAHGGDCYDLFKALADR
jgi:hypothetical protein